MSPKPWANGIQALALVSSLCAVSACSGPTGVVGEFPLAQRVADENKYILTYATEPESGGAPFLNKWRLQQMPGGSLDLVWEANAPTIESPDWQLAALHAKRDEAPNAWIVGLYSGDQFRVYRITPDGEAAHWEIPGENSVPAAFGMRVTTSPDKEVWITFDQPYKAYEDEVFAPLIVVSGNRAAIARQGVYWAACDEDGCTTVEERSGEILVQRAGKTVRSFQPRDSRRTSPLRAVCTRPELRVLVSELAAYPIDTTASFSPSDFATDEFAIQKDGGARLPQSWVNLFIETDGHLECDGPRWSWLTVHGEQYALEFSTGTITPFGSKAADNRVLFDASPLEASWFVSFAEFEKEETLGCSSPRDSFGTCVSSYARYRLGSAIISDPK